MHTNYRSAIIGAFAATMIVSSSVSEAFAKVGSATFEGEVQHVSVNNIKVYNPRDKKTESFLILPKFKQVFSNSGKTTSQMSALHPGQYVKVYYDQSFLGARHADRIWIMNNSNMKLGHQ